MDQQLIKKIIFAAMICAPVVIMASEKISYEQKITVSLLKNVLKANSFLKEFYKTEETMVHSTVKTVLEKTKKMFPDLKMKEIEQQAKNWKIQGENVSLPTLKSQYSGGRAEENKLYSIELCIFSAVQNLDKHLTSLEKKE